MVETMLREYPNVLTLRVRMPIVADLTYARNFITKVRRVVRRKQWERWEALRGGGKGKKRKRNRKQSDDRAPPANPPPRLVPKKNKRQIIKYDKVIDIPNSMTVLPELLPMAIDMVSSVVGVCSFRKDWAGTPAPFLKNHTRHRPRKPNQKQKHPKKIYRPSAGSRAS